MLLFTSAEGHAAVPAGWPRPAPPPAGLAVDADPLPSLVGAPVRPTARVRSELALPAGEPAGERIRMKMGEGGTLSAPSAVSATFAAETVWCGLRRATAGTRCLLAACCGSAQRGGKQRALAVMKHPRAGAVCPARARSDAAQSWRGRRLAGLPHGCRPGPTWRLGPGPAGPGAWQHSAVMPRCEPADRAVPRPPASAQFDIRRHGRVDHRD